MQIEALRQYLKGYGPVGAPEGCRQLGVSQPTFSRLISALQGELVIGGEARTTRYALGREIPGLSSPIPIHEVDEVGKASQLGCLHPIWPKGFYFETRQTALRSEWLDDLPFFLDDLRPNGFLGRLIPKRHPELAAPSDIRLWTAEHCLAYLSRFEMDGVGNLIVGDESFRLYLASIASPGLPVPLGERSHVYPKLALEVLALGPAGSSAGGEQPKFLAIKGPKRVSVMVKFSPLLEDEASRRIADLLNCEHLAHRVLQDHGMSSPASTIIKGGKRFFLEIERFDRIGPHGRRGLLSLGVLDSQFLGRLGNWDDTALGLRQKGIIDESARRAISWMECFGALIANTDRHRGNLSFFAERARPIRLAPVYDMLPMLYYPHHGQLAFPPFEPPLPSSALVADWKGASRAAEAFWRRVASHPEISKKFRSMAQSNAKKVKSLSALEAYLPKTARIRPPHIGH